MRHYLMLAKNIGILASVMALVSFIHGDISYSGIIEEYEQRLESGPKIMKPGYLDRVEDKGADIRDRIRQQNALSGDVLKLDDKLQEKIDDEARDAVKPDLQKKKSASAEGALAGNAVPGITIALTAIVDLGVAGEIIEEAIENGEDIVLENGHILHAWREEGETYFNVKDASGASVIERQQFTAGTSGSDLTGMSIGGITRAAGGNYSVELRTQHGEMDNVTYDSLYYTAYDTAYSGFYSAMSRTDFYDTPFGQYLLAMDPYFMGTYGWYGYLDLWGAYYQYDQWCWGNTSAADNEFLESLYEIYGSTYVDQILSQDNTTSVTYGSGYINYSFQEYDLYLFRSQYAGTFSAYGNAWYYAYNMYNMSDSVPDPERFGDDAYEFANRYAEQFHALYYSFYESMYNSTYAYPYISGMPADLIGNASVEDYASAYARDNAIRYAFMGMSYDYVSFAPSQHTDTAIIAEVMARNKIARWHYADVKSGKVLNDYVLSGYVMDAGVGYAEMAAQNEADAEKQIYEEGYDPEIREIAPDYTERQVVNPAVHADNAWGWRETKSRTTESVRYSGFDDVQGKAKTSTLAAGGPTSEESVMIAALLGNAIQDTLGAGEGGLNAEELATILTRAIENSALIGGIINLLKENDIDIEKLLADMIKNLTGEQRAMLATLGDILNRVRKAEGGKENEELEIAARDFAERVVAIILTQALPELLADEVSSIGAIFSELDEEKTATLLEYRETDAVKQYYRKIAEDLADEMNIGILKIKDILLDEHTKEDIQNFSQEEIDDVLARIRGIEDKTHTEQAILANEAEYARNEDFIAAREKLEHGMKGILDNFSQELLGVLYGAGLVEEKETEGGAITLNVDLGLGK